MCEGLYDKVLEFGTLNRGDWLSPSSSGKCTVSMEENSQCNSDSLLGNFTHIFSEDSYDVGCIRLEPQKVVLTSELAVSLLPYRTSPQNNIEIETQIKRVLEANIIKPSHSLYAAPVTLVKRKDEGRRPLKKH
ncbi:retrovirus-related Pol polyprotein from transposon 17.6 [Nephila pilipes]|uniref:Retrovirus-related Pol polyprotein from transposon 17.6 n=1 Tax=Nephila pilipes TaxID=299642 RepID=A0A8X6MZB6_NEPPI|nr:retrovirus-related Pol polyprotein from transposon 17.6 [Nephila pilipes]